MNLLCFPPIFYLAGVLTRVMAIDEFIVRSVTLEKTIGRVKQNLDFKRESFFQLEISSPFILRGISFHIFVRAFPRVPFSPILLGARGIKQTFKTLNFFFAHRARISFLLTFVYNFFLYFSTEVWQKTNHRQSLPRKCWTWMYRSSTRPPCSVFATRRRTLCNKQQVAVTR